eukprot:jgi/Ulvmu1/7019/UM033_0078.1
MGPRMLADAMHDSNGPDVPAAEVNTGSKCTASGEPGQGQAAQTAIPESNAPTVTPSEGAQVQNGEPTLENRSKSPSSYNGGREGANNIAKAPVGHADADCGRSPPKKVQCVRDLPQDTGTTQPDASRSAGGGACHKSTAGCTSNEVLHTPSQLEQTLIKFTSRVETEVLAACHDSTKGGEIVPQIFEQYRPRDSTNVETIDLLDE